MTFRAVLTFAGCIALAACGNSAYEGQILGTLERDRLELVAESNEPIVEISVREGDAVAAGATLLRQELGSMQARLDQAVAARNVAERRLAELVKGPRAQEITEARAGLEAARSMLETETNEYQRVQDLVSRKGKDVPPLVSLPPTARIGEAIRIMQESDVSQIPVIHDGQVVGNVREDQIIDLLLHTPSRQDAPIEEIMEDGVPEVAADTPVDEIQRHFLNGHSAVLVRVPGGRRGILTKYDLIHGLARTQGRC